MALSSDTKIEITKLEVDQLKDAVEQLFLERSEIYLTEINEIIERGEKVLTTLQNRLDLVNPDIIV